MKSSRSSTLVYSTDPNVRQSIEQADPVVSARTSGDGIVRLSYETKGRKGKGVTVIRGVPLDENALAALGKTLRTACGTGGATKDGVLEIQGDHRDRVTQLLQPKGWPIKRVGG